MLEDLDLVLRILERRLAIGQQLRSALVGGERFLERKLAAFHGRHNALELRECGFEGLGRFCGAHEELKGSEVGKIFKVGPAATARFQKMFSALIFHVRS